MAGGNDGADDAAVRIALVGSCCGAAFITGQLPAQHGIDVTIALACDFGMQHTPASGCTAATTSNTTATIDNARFTVKPNSTVTVGIPQHSALCVTLHRDVTTITRIYIVSVMKESSMRLLAVLLTILLPACGGKNSIQPSKENTYPMTATIVSRDPAQNTLTMDNKDIPGVMEAMRMDYELRGTKVNALPPNGTPVTATLHERDGRYWVTDVRPHK